MNDQTDANRLRPPLREAAIPADDFRRAREANLARWPTGADVDFDAAVALHTSLPAHKRLAGAMRRAHAERRCLTQPRGGFGTFSMQKALMIALDREGLADIVPTTTDSYTRNEQFAAAQKGIDESERLGRSLLNGFPIVNYGIAACRELVGAIDKPAIMLTGTSMPKLTSEIGFAAGYTGYLGSGIAYTTSYIKELSIEDGIRNYQYLDRLAAPLCRARRGAASPPAGIPDRHQHPAVHRDRDCRPRLPSCRCAGRQALRARARADAASRSRTPRRLLHANRLHRNISRGSVIATCSRRSRRCTGWARGRTTMRRPRRL